MPIDTFNFQKRIIGQDDALDKILPYIQMHEAGLSPEGRPIGVFMLMGPTGVGKTRVCEVIAEALHRSEKRMLRVDCGEFQMEHEVAKLIGAPPGYLGHRETGAMLSQNAINNLRTDKAAGGSDIGIILFDEIEKAADSLRRILLGILDKGSLKIGDNTSVDFEKTLIFMTSNLGARQMQQAAAPDFGFGANAGIEHHKIQKIGMTAMRKRFTPEFINRIDETVMFQALTSDHMREILDIQIEALQRHITRRLIQKSFTIKVDDSAKDLLLSEGVSIQYGARELKRVMLRKITQPLAVMVASGEITPDRIVRITAEGGEIKFGLRKRAA